MCGSSWWTSIFFRFLCKVHFHLYAFSLCSHLFFIYKFAADLLPFLPQHFFWMLFYFVLQSTLSVRLSIRKVWLKASGFPPGTNTSTSTSTTSDSQTASILTVRLEFQHKGKLTRTYRKKTQTSHCLGYLRDKVLMSVSLILPGWRHWLLGHHWKMIKTYSYTRYHL